MKFDFISKISKENSQNYYFCLQFDDWILLKGEKILFGKRLLKKEIMKSGLKFNFWVSANRTSNNWALVGVCACGILDGSNGFQWERKEINRRQISIKGDYKGGLLMSGGGGRGIMRILQSLMGGSGEFYSDTTKILPSPSPLPQAIKKMTSPSPFTSHEWPRDNFSLQIQYNIKHRSDENKVKYQLGDY